MATIDIFPLSIGGVKLPGNLLDSVLSRNDTARLLYPLDLVNNPIYGHAIQFTVYDYNYPHLTEAFGKVKDSIMSGYSNIQSNGGKINAETLKNLGNVAKKGVPEALGAAPVFITGTNYVPTRGKAFANISLYLPDTLTTSFDSDYTAVSLTETFGLPGVVAAGYQSYKKNIDKEAGFNTASKEAVSAALDGVTKGIAGNVLKTVLNPQLQMIYRGVGLREFQFEFLFTPSSKKEADAIEKIVKSFMYYSLPEKIDDGQFLTPPQIFGIQFIYTGGDSFTNTISDIFKKSLTNVLGTQLTGWLSGGNPTGNMAQHQNTKLFDIGDCVLSNVTVDYAPNGWASHQDGQPVQTRLTLQFKEMNIRTKSDMLKAGFNPKTLPESAPINNTVTPTKSAADSSRPVQITPYDWGLK